MKKSIIIICLLMMVGYTGISYGQDASKETPVLTVQQQEAVDAMIEMDPKLSTKEIEQLKIAVRGAPAKAEPMSDPKLNEQPQVVLAPVDAQPVEHRELAISEPITQNAKSTNTQVGTQPEGEKSSVKVVNYRTIQGPQIQPEGKKSESVVNYRAIKGPNTQPEGDKPDDNN